MQNRELDRAAHYTSAGAHRLAPIDAIRGWAILLVITSHVGELFPELPWPVKKATNFGWYGVQLFFIASAFTLLMSWHKNKRPVGIKARRFFVRRFFRIAPMYYLGALLYLAISWPGDKFSWDQLGASLTFINGWSPTWLTTVPGGWQVVPGGWSISVEFSFYVIFPFLASGISSLRSCVKFLALSTTLMLVMHSVGEAALPASLPPEAVDNFLFFWLPNQIAIFALGFTLFFVLSNASIHERLEDYAKNKQTRVFVVGALFLVALTQFGTLKFVDSRPPWIPSHFLTACVFALLMAVLMASDKPLRIVVNPFLTKLGEVSFSAYLLHFAVLELARAHAQLLGLDANRVETLIRLPITLFLVLLITFALSSVTYRVVELPMIGLGRRIK